MQTSKQKGFTLIELLVVIVIIGILATISVATFSGYFAKARDAERQSTVRNAATVLKTARAVESIQTFDFDATGGLDSSAADIDGGVATIAGVGNVLNAEGGFIIPDASTANYEYIYVSTATLPANNFAIFVCSEETPETLFADGTAEVVAALRANAATFCPNPVTATSIELDTVDAAGGIGVLETNSLN